MVGGSVNLLSGLAAGSCNEVCVGRQCRFGRVERMRPMIGREKERERKSERQPPRTYIHACERDRLFCLAKLGWLSEFEGQLSYDMLPFFPWDIDIGVRFVVTAVRVVLVRAQKLGDV